jgi:hypothetical protein
MGLVSNDMDGDRHSLFDGILPRQLHHKPCSVVENTVQENHHYNSVLCGNRRSQGRILEQAHRTRMNASKSITNASAAMNHDRRDFWVHMQHVGAILQMNLHFNCLWLRSGVRFTVQRRRPICGTGPRSP